MIRGPLNPGGASSFIGGRHIGSFTLTELAALATGSYTANKTFAFVSSPISDVGPYVWDGSAWVRIGHKPTLQLPAIVDQTRNSLNNATDDDEMVAATFTIPAGTLKAGSYIELIAWWENTNSANTKNYLVYIAGSNVTSTTATTNPSHIQRWPIHVHNATTILTANNFYSAGGNIIASALTSTTVSDVTTNALVIDVRTKWSTQPISGEFIRLKHAKLQIHP